MGLPPHSAFASERSVLPPISSIFALFAAGDVCYPSSVAYDVDPALHKPRTKNLRFRRISTEFSSLCEVTHRFHISATKEFCLRNTCHPTVQHLLLGPPRISPRHASRERLERSVPFHPRRPVSRDGKGGSALCVQRIRRTTDLEAAACFSKNSSKTRRWPSARSYSPILEQSTP